MRFLNAADITTAKTNRAQAGRFEWLVARTFGAVHQQNFDGVRVTAYECRGKLYLAEHDAKWPHSFSV
jgi:hypothetical protein